MPGQGTTDQRGGRPRPLLRWVQRPIVLLDWSGQIIAALTLAFLFCALLVNVILRYVMNTGLPWASEIHAVLLPWMVAGGVVIAAARGRNIAITLLPDLLGAQARRWLFVAVNVMILVIALSVLWSSQPILKAAQVQRLSTLGIKQIWGYSSLIYAFGGMAVIALLDMLRLLVERDVSASDPTKTSLS
jgi:TRAP-type C4-dicarboxylate transport system permease small subunit